MVIRVAPGFGPPPEGRRGGRPGVRRGGHRGRGLYHGNGFIEVVDGNPGEFTIPAAVLQELLDGEDAVHLLVGVGQMTATDVAHGEGIVKALLRNGDGVRLTLE